MYSVSAYPAAVDQTGDHGDDLLHVLGKEVIFRLYEKNFYCEHLRITRGFCSQLEFS